MGPVYLSLLFLDLSLMRVRLRVHMHDTGRRQLLDHVEGFDFQKERAFDMYISIGYSIFLHSYPEGLWSH